MRQESESLEDLAAPDEKFEHSATLASEDDPEALDERRREPEKTFLPAMDGIEASAWIHRADAGGATVSR